MSDATVDRVGVRELRDGLSRYLGAVKAGDEIVVTEHGRPIARITPVDTSVYRRLVAEGRVLLPEQANESEPLRPRVQARHGSVSDLIER